MVVNTVFGCHFLVNILWWILVGSLRSLSLAGSKKVRRIQVENFAQKYNNFVILERSPLLYFYIPFMLTVQTHQVLAFTSLVHSLKHLLWLEEAHRGAINPQILRRYESAISNSMAERARLLEQLAASITKHDKTS